jgi:acetyl esterase/lipase
MRARWAIMAVSVAVAAGGCTGRPEPVATAAPCGSREAAPPVEVAYGDHGTLTALDVYPLAPRAGCPPSPVLVWVHGGGWQAGDKGNRMADKRRLAAEQGWVLVSVNYRLVPQVRYPVPNEDVAAAVAWVTEHAGEHGGDPARVALMGHSAGGGIVAAVTTDERYLAAHGLTLSAVDCAVALDTEGYDVAARAEDVAAYAAMFGTDPALWPDMSPITHVAAGKGIPSYFIVTRGRPTRIATSQRFADALEGAGVPTTVLVATGLSHADVNEAVGRAGDTIVTPPLTGFLTTCFT